MHAYVSKRELLLKNVMLWGTEQSELPAQYAEPSPNIAGAGRVLFVQRSAHAPECCSDATCKTTCCSTKAR